MNISVSFSYGIGNVVTKQLTTPITIADALRDNPTIKAGLGLPEKYDALVDGRRVDMEGYMLNNNVTIVFEQQAAAKAL